jgi:hypothetical protein
VRQVGQCGLEPLTLPYQRDRRPILAKINNVSRALEKPRQTNAINWSPNS